MTSGDAMSWIVGIYSPSYSTIVGFKSANGINDVIESGLWMVNSKPMFVQKWDPFVCLEKAEPTKLPLWVKFKNLPLEAWSIKGISIASWLGNPLIMDQVTTHMCNMGNGRTGFARVLIEVEACKGFHDQIEIVYRNSDNMEIERKYVKVEYDWKPPLCSFCSMFGHKDDKCSCRPKTVEEIEAANEELRKMNEAKRKEKESKEEFVQVNRKKPPSAKQVGKNNRYMQGVKKDNVTYQPVKRKVDVEGSKGNSSEVPETGKVNNAVNESPSIRNKWNVNESVLDSIRKSANKFFVLIDDPGEEGNDEDVNVFQNEEDDEGEVAPSSTDVMDVKIVAWNIRGLGKLSKQNAIKNLLNDEKLVVCAILETRLKGPKVKRIGDIVFGRWSWLDNAHCSSRGCRIMVGWNNNKAHCMVIHTSDQAMLCLIEILNTKERILCTFIHAETVGSLRKKLWADLSIYKTICNNNPWVIMGDMNVSLNLEDHSEGISYKSQDMEDFQDCVNILKTHDVASTGLHYTWTKSLLNPNSSILKKIDRVIGNEEFFYAHRRAHVVFLPYGISDHSPAVLTCSKAMKSPSRSFRFANYVADKEEFKTLIEGN
ncbi:RNA-directed DNA polymerase, eukaryota, reverse transcriptase zinc-binding domain protein [Tanacetum coccineum]